MSQVMGQELCEVCLGPSSGSLLVSHAAVVVVIVLFYFVLFCFVLAR